MLPLGLGYVEGVTHDYERHGTTTLFAALDIANGQVLTDCKPRHRNQEFLGFLKQIDANVPPELDVYLVMDNYATHKHANVKAWFARHPRFHPHLRRRSGRHPEEWRVDHWRWPSAFFAAHGLFSMTEAHAALCQSARR